MRHGIPRISYAAETNKKNKGEGSNIVLSSTILYKQQAEMRMAKGKGNGLLQARVPNLWSLTQDSKCENLNT